MHWYLQEAVTKQLRELSAYSNIEFPPKRPDDYFEPIGVEYSHYKDWSKVQSDINRWIQLSSSGGGKTAPAMDIVAPHSSMPLLAAAPSSLPASDAPLTQIPMISTSGPFVPFPMPPLPISQQAVDYYAPQAKWAHRLGPMGAHRVSVLNQFLAPTKPLSAYQRDKFWECVLEAREFHGGDVAVMDQVKDTIVDVWNNKHLHKIQLEGSGIGLGGLIRSAHVGQLLRAKGYDVKAGQIGGLEPSTKKAVATLGRNDIRNLSYQQAEPWLRKIGKNVRNTKAKRHEDPSRW